MNPKNRCGASEILIMGFQHSKDVVLFQFSQGYPASSLCCGLHRRALDRLR